MLVINIMEEKTLKILEFDKIRERLSKKAVMNASAERLLKIQPFTDLEKVRTLLSQTDEARSISVKYGSAPLAPVADAVPVVKRSQIGAMLSCAELLCIAHVLRITRKVLQYIDIRDFETDYPALNYICSRLEAVRDVEKNIFEAVISEEELDDHASPALFEIRKKKFNLTNKIKDILNDIIHSPTLVTALQDPIVTIRDGRYVVPVKAEQRGMIPGVVHNSSQTGATLFVEPMKVVETNNQIRMLDSEEKEEINRILSELSAQVSENAETIITNYKTLINIDVIFAKARFADEMEAACPEINADGIIEIKKGRHPLLDKKKAVPIDIRLGEDFDTLVITGPNTGGKTVSLKTLGLFTIMTQAGLHIPAKEGSKMAVFEKVFADIGDEQSIEQSLSTFSAHMVNIVNIIKNVDSSSLVLFDELGAGTDPTEGAALAGAILLDVMSKGAKTAATTHYSEIKLLAISTDRIENAACEFDVEKLCPTYRLLVGALGRSNAFAIASRLGMDDYIIENAKNTISSQKIEFEDIVNKIEEMGQKAEKNRDETERARLAAEKFRKELEEERAKIEKEKQKIMDNARQEAKRLVTNAKKEIEEEIKEIKAISAQERVKALEEAKSKLKSKENILSDQLYDSTVKAIKGNLKASDVKPGCEVFVNLMQKKGIALSKPDKDGNLEVQVGIIKLRTNISDLSKVLDTNVQKVVRDFKKSRTNIKLNAVKPEIDLRGMALDEASLVMDKYIDDAVLAHLSVVTIVHGKGTGILRAGLQEDLKRHPSVKSFRDGKYGEGENGVTIVELK